MRSARASGIEDRSRLVDLPRSLGRVWVTDLGPVGVEGREGPCPVLFLHGLLTSGYEWWQVAESMSTPGPRCRRTLAIDLPGCGNSDRPAPTSADGYSPAWLADVCAALLDALQIPRVLLVGHQFGGAVAVTLAAARPVCVAGLVLIAPICFPARLPIHLPDAVPGWRPFWRYVGLMPLVFRTLFRRDVLRRFLARTLSTPELLDEDEVDVHWDRLCRDGGLEAAQAMVDQCEDEGALAEISGRCRALESPTLIVWGDSDLVVPRTAMDRLSTLIPRSRGVVLDGCGHAPQRERPPALLESMATWEAEMVDGTAPVPH